MIGDARHIVYGTTVEADICIVGAGAAGITLALELLRSGMRILLLEAGGSAEDPDDQALYQGEVADPSLHSPPDKYRQRRFGGSTTIWGGRCVPFDPMEFEDRSWIPIADGPSPTTRWPHTIHARTPLCEAGDFSLRRGSRCVGGYAPLVGGFLAGGLHHQSASSASAARPTLADAIGIGWPLRLPYGSCFMRTAHVLSLRRMAPAIEQATVQTLDGNQFGVVATRFILATGALEVARLLLASRDVHATGNRQ